MARFSATKPYNDLPSLPPKVEIETMAVLKKCADARAATAALQQACALIPNAAVLINSLPILEAQASSEIENIVTTTDALFRYAPTDQSPNSATKEALRYRTALREGVESLKRKPLSTSTTEAVCSTIKGVEMRVRRVPGTKLTHQSSGKVIYTPPVGESLLRDKLANWERFIHNSTDIDPLVRMAVAHYQFEAIHPFTDGNGRTGRILIQLFLIEAGLLDLPVLYLSGYILRNRARYYDLLLGVTTKREWEEWILYILTGVEETGKWTTDRIHAIRSLMSKTTEEVRKKLPKLYSRELVELLFTQPYCRIRNVVDAGLAQRQTASEYLQALADIGVLKSTKAGRETLYVHPAFMNLLVRNELSKQKGKGKGRSR